MVQDTVAQSEPVRTPTTRRTRPRVVLVRRREPILRPSRAGAVGDGVFGIDLTAGCGLGCAFCHVRGSALFPGEGRVLFDPTVSERLDCELAEQDRPVRRVVLSPLSDPLPPFPGIRAATTQITRSLLERGIEVVLMTRARVPKVLIDLLAEHPGKARVAVALTTLSRPLSHILEPMAPPPRIRLRGLERLIQAGVPVEVRLEPLIWELTDTRENLKPLFLELARLGVYKVVAHYLFLQASWLPTLQHALEPRGLSEKLIDDYEGGPVFSLGSLGATKHLPIDARREGLARLIAWGAEHGLAVETSAAQNPDLPKHGDFVVPPKAARPARPRKTPKPQKPTEPVAATP